LLNSFPGSKALLHRYSEEKWSARLAFITTFVAGPPPDDLEEAHQWFDTHWHDLWSARRRHDLWSAERADSDPISNLLRIPVPEDLERSFFEKDLKGRASMCHALAAFVGAPAEFDGNKAIVELVLFAPPASLVLTTASRCSRGRTPCGIWKDRPRPRRYFARRFRQTLTARGGG